MLPITTLMRTLSVVAFMASVVVAVLSLFIFAWSVMGEPPVGDDPLGALVISAIVMLISIIAYQLCRLHEARQPDQDELDLMAALIAEMRAERAAERETSEPPPPSENP